VSGWDIVLILTAFAVGFIVGTVFGAMTERLAEHERKAKVLRDLEEQSRRRHPTGYVDEQLRLLFGEEETD